MKPISQPDADFFRSLGKRIALARKNADLTQQQLAEALGISQPMLASYEVGRRRLPASMLIPLADALKVSVPELLDQQPTNGKRGPLPKLQRQVELVRSLPRSRQKLVAEFLDTILQSDKAS